MKTKLRDIILTGMLFLPVLLWSGGNQEANDLQRPQAALQEEAESVEWDFSREKTAWRLEEGAFIEGGFLHVPPGARAMIASEADFRVMSMRIEADGPGAFRIEYGASASESFILELSRDYTRLLHRSGGSERELVQKEPVMEEGSVSLINAAVVSDRESHHLLVNGEHIYAVKTEPPVSIRFAAIHPVEDIFLHIDSAGISTRIEEHIAAVLTESHIDEAAAFSTDPARAGEERGISKKSDALLPGGVRGFSLEEAKDLPAVKMDRSAVSDLTSKGWKRLGGPIGGIGYDIRYDFGNPDKWYVTDSNSGINISTDNGKNWVPSNHNITTRLGPSADIVPIFCSTADHINTDTVWIGTEGGGDIWKSTDGGKSWQLKVNGLDTEIKPGLTFRGFTVHPTDADTVYAMAELGSEFCTEERIPAFGKKFDKTKGIIFRTTDGGDSWKEIWRGDALTRICLINPENTDIMYVSTGIFDREAWNSDWEKGIAGGLGVLKTTDGGRTWKPLGKAHGLTDLCVGMLVMHPEDPDTLLAAAGNLTYSDQEGDCTGGIFLTTDGGMHWKKVIGGEIFTVAEFAVANPNIAYAASNAAVYRSNDGGRTWKRFPEVGANWGPPGIYPGFPIDMEDDPRDPDRVFINNYLGGNFLSVDAGETWKTASNGYCGAEVDGIGLYADDPRFIYTAGRTGIFKSSDFGESWEGCCYTSQGEEGIHSVDFSEARTIAVNPDNRNNIIISPGISGIARSTDGGRSWRFKKTEGPVNRIEMAPSRPQTVYFSVVGDKIPEDVLRGYEGSLLFEGEFSGAGLYVSHDGGATFKPLGGRAAGRSFTALAVGPRDPDLVIAGSYSGELLKSNDGGGTWTDISISATPYPALTIAVDKDNSDVMFAGTAGSAVFKTTDGGRTWRHAGRGLLPEAYINKVLIHPKDPHIVIAGDLTSGVYVSMDGGNNWRPHLKGLLNRAIFDIEIADDGSVLYASTFKGGMFRLDIP
jgi:photosystem II stability/assembly factor-like uncharacterized protein